MNSQYLLQLVTILDNFYLLLSISLPEYKSVRINIIYNRDSLIFNLFRRIVETAPVYASAILLRILDWKGYRLECYEKKA
jgi:hypothetical protein